MKIEFTKIKAKNFLSIGAVPVEFDYSKGLHKIVGTVIGEDTKNGCGKTTIILDAIIFAVYGKSLRNLNLNEMINSINQSECEITLWFKIDNKPYRIERGIKPNYLRFIDEEKESSEIIEESARKSSTQQDILNVLKINMVTLINVITMNLNYSKPFFKLNPQEKRKILEDSTNVAIYGKMYENIKKQTNEYKNDRKILINDVKNLKQNYTEKVETFNKLEILKQKFETSKQIDITNLNTQILNIKTKIAELEQKLIDKNYSDIKTKITKTILEVNTQISKIETDTIYVKKDNKKYEAEITDLNNNPICPRCKSPATSEHTQIHISSLKANIETNSKIINDNNIKLEEYYLKLNELKEKDKKITNILEQINQINIKINQYKENITQLNKQLVILETKTFDTADLITEQMVLDSKTKLETKEAEYNTLETKLVYCEYLKDVLGDSGIKTYIIKKLVPLLNKKMNHYLSLFKFYHSITFDNELQETLKSRKRDKFSYENFSSGEQRRIDLAMMFALLSINKLQNSIDCNILILDEVLDSSLCEYGTIQIIEFLRNDFKLEHPNLCTYVISHKKEINDMYFDSIINVVKQNNFTKIGSITINDMILT